MGLPLDRLEKSPCECQAAPVAFYSVDLPRTGPQFLLVTFCLSWDAVFFFLPLQKSASPESEDAPKPAGALLFCRQVRTSLPGSVFSLM